MNLQIAKWGSSLALRIPAEYLRSAGIKEGDSVEASLTVDGGLTIRPTTWNPGLRARTGIGPRGHADGQVCHGRSASRRALLMVYVDTSVLVALHLNEPGAPPSPVGTARAPTNWYRPCGV